MPVDTEQFEAPVAAPTETTIAFEVSQPAVGSGDISHYSATVESVRAEKVVLEHSDEVETPSHPSEPVRFKAVIDPECDTLHITLQSHVRSPSVVGVSAPRVVELDMADLHRDHNYAGKVTVRAITLREPPHLRVVDAPKFARKARHVKDDTLAARIPTQGKPFAIGDAVMVDGRKPGRLVGIDRHRDPETGKETGTPVVRIRDGLPQPVEMSRVSRPLGGK